MIRKGRIRPSRQLGESGSNTCTQLETFISRISNTENQPNHATIGNSATPANLAYPFARSTLGRGSQVARPHFFLPSGLGPGFQLKQVPVIPFYFGERSWFTDGDLDIHEPYTVRARIVWQWRGKNLLTHTGWWPGLWLFGSMAAISGTALLPGLALN
jgi:hypothetical protein